MLVGTAAVLPMSEKVKSLGVILDSQLKFGDHMNSVAKACNYHVWALRHIRHLLTTDIAQTLACSIVSSKLDYCNAVRLRFAGEICCSFAMSTEQSRSCRVATAETYPGEAASTITPLASSYSAD